ncbi:MAG: hypothetical protein K8T10_15130 [Candidatus Eremiobacteraeota bacterium]|nr:hypothetical protein [Candidatus Eremiobacteraeota bacterium]
MVEQFKTWFENTPHAVIFLGIAILLFTFLFAWVLKSLKGLEAKTFYNVAKKLDLQVISPSSGSGKLVPRIMGYSNERNIEITGYDKYEKGLILNYVRIKISQKAYVVRKIEIEYSPGDNPSLQRFIIENETCSKEDLLKRKAFDEKVLNELDELFKTYARGEANQNSFITFLPETIDFDRAITITGNEEHLLGSISKLYHIAESMEQKGS